MAWSWKNLFGFGGDESRNKRGSGGFEFQPYSGLRPPRIDYTDAAGKNVEILRPVQKQDFDITMRQSLGQDVGYDPARRQAAQALLESRLGKQREDDVRAAQGRVSASGLSGNLRAQEALTGRVNRDYGRTLGEGTNLLNIEDLTRASDDRQAAINRLALLNRSNFGQENKVADFDLAAYGAEQGARADAFGLNEGVRRYDQTRSDENFSDLLGTGLDVATTFLSPQSKFYTEAANALMANKTGQGIAPQDYINTSSGPGVRRSAKPYRALVR